MEKSEFIKKEVTFERVLMGVAVVLLVVVMSLYYLGFFDNPNEGVNGENIQSDFLQQEQSLTDDFVIEEEEELEIEEYVEPQEQEEEIVVLPTTEFIQCLADSGMVIYGSSTCGACANLVNLFGGYEAVGPIYVECSGNWDICGEKTETGYVPEIRINDVLFGGANTLENFAAQTGCEL